MAAHKQIKVLDLATLDRVIGGCRVQAISPVAPPPRADYSGMLLSTGAEMMIRDGASGFSLDQVGALDQIFAELEHEPMQQGSFEAVGSVAPANEVEAAEPVLRDTVDEGEQAATPDGTHSGTMVIANPGRVVNAHVVAAIRTR